MAKRLAAFTIPTGRLNLIELNGIRFIDDTYNANPLSLGAALDVLGNLKTRGRKILVMGDMLELGSRSRFFHRKAGTELAGICDIFVGVGKMTHLAAERAREAGLERGNIFTCNSSLEARDILYKIILPKKEDVVLVKGSRSMRMEEVLKK
jgi:UDP-N-acetylmuramoyl-tripeptide--D-alanyl-D-alanine ligase